MMNSFKGELSQGATQQIEALSGVMGETVSSLTQMPDVIQQSQAKFETMLSKMEDLGEGMMSRVQEAFANANQKAVEAQMTLINESNQASQAIRQAQEEVGTQMVLRKETNMYLLHLQEIHLLKKDFLSSMKRHFKVEMVIYDLEIRTLLKIQFLLF